MKLINQWIGYVERGYEQMRASIISKLSTEAPEITDYSYSNPFIKTVSIFAGVGEHLNFYIDGRAREAFLVTARDYSSAVKYAAQVDYRVHGAQAAAVDLEFSVTAAAGTATVIPINTVARTNTGLEYRTTVATVLPAGQTTVLVPARNWKPVNGSVLGVSNGTLTQRFVIGPDVVDNNIVVLVGATPWLPVETFAFSNAQERHFRPAINGEGVMELTFGDGISGAIPGAGQTISVSYYTSDGRLGNVASNTITEMSTFTAANGAQLRVRNPQRASGGMDIESLQELQKRIPLANRTQERAVSTQDFIDTALLAPGVAQAGLTYSCGEGATIYISPAGGGIASSDLINSVDNFFESRRIVMTPILVKAAGEVVVKFSGRLKVRPNYYRDTTAALAIANLLDFMRTENQQIKGTLDIGNVYEVLENTEGIEVTELTRMTTVPYARPQEHNTELNWEVETQPGSTATLVWRLSLTAANEIEVLRGTTFVGLYAIGERVETEEVAFTVLPGQYTTGQSWEFYTYNYSGSLTLAEQSVPVTGLEFLDFTVTGGLI